MAERICRKAKSLLIFSRSKNKPTITELPTPPVFNFLIFNGISELQKEWEFCGD